MQKQPITHLPEANLVRLITALEPLPILLNTAVAIMPATRKQPGMLTLPRRSLVIFQFTDTEENRAVIVSYATGEPWLSAKSLTACRAWLHRKAKEVRPC
jgi:hypothetical protein